MKKSFLMLALSVLLMGLVMVSCDTLGGNDTPYVVTYPLDVYTAEVEINGDVPNWIDEDNLINSFYGLVADYKDDAINFLSTEGIDINLRGNRVTSSKIIYKVATQEDWVSLQEGLGITNDNLREYGISFSLSNPAEGYVKLTATIDATYVRVKEITITNWADLNSGGTFKEFADGYLGQLTYDIVPTYYVTYTYDELGNEIEERVQYPQEQIDLMKSMVDTVNAFIEARIKIKENGVEFIGSAGGIDIPLTLVEKLMDEMFVGPDGQPMNPPPVDMEFLDGVLTVTLN